MEAELVDKIWGVVFVVMMVALILGINKNN